MRCMSGKQAEGRAEMEVMHRNSDLKCFEIDIMLNGQIISKESEDRPVDRY